MVGLGRCVVCRVQSPQNRRKENASKQKNRQTVTNICKWFKTPFGPPLNTQLKPLTTTKTWQKPQRCESKSCLFGEENNPTSWFSIVKRAGCSPCYGKAAAFFDSKAVQLLGQTSSSHCRCPFEWRGSRMAFAQETMIPPEAGWEEQKQHQGWVELGETCFYVGLWFLILVVFAYTLVFLLCSVFLVLFRRLLD